MTSFFRGLLRLAGTGTNPRFNISSSLSSSTSIVPLGRLLLRDAEGTSESATTKTKSLR